jgi:nicotinamide-nucleotide adenylyltransferase
MNVQETSLFIGRFQPFHKGHLDAVNQIFEQKKTKFLFIGIGSAENNFVPDNPFTAGERFEMILESLLEAGYPMRQFHICPLRNIDHYCLWPEHIVQLLPPFSRVFSGSPLVRYLFQKKTLHLRVEELIDRTNISATKVREFLSHGTYPKTLLPPASMYFLKKINASERVQVLSQTGFVEENN